MPQPGLPLAPRSATDTRSISALDVDINVDAGADEFETAEEPGAFAIKMADGRRMVPPTVGCVNTPGSAPPRSLAAASAAVVEEGKEANRV